MLAWFRSQVRDHGLVAALGLFLRVVANRCRVLLSNKFLAGSLECPCCGWKGSRFFDYIEAGYRVPNAACPNCDSHSRHRAFHLWLTNQYRIDTRNGRALIFAPERALAPVWNSARNLKTIKTDIESTRGVDLLSDVMHLPLASESISLIWCHHVLEQVVDDVAAMKELLRVLNPSGELLISAGLSEMEQTQEMGTANKKFSGNRRLYGNDFSDRLRQAGFAVMPLNYNLSASELKRFAIRPEFFFRCTKPHESTIRN